jgi:hypothetical protein
MYKKGYSTHCAKMSRRPNTLIRPPTSPATEKPLSVEMQGLDFMLTKPA